MGKRSFFICVIILFSFQFSFAQVPDQESGGKEDNVEIDTVIIKKEAYVIRKQVYIDDTKKTAEYSKSIELSVAPAYYINYYDVCEDCKEFLTNQKKATSPSLGYRVGLNLSLSRNRMFLIPGIAYSSLRESYSSSDSYGAVYEVNNHYDYLDLAMGVGYKIGQNKLSCIIAANAIMSKLVNVDGKIIASSDFTSTKDLTKSDLKSYIYSLGLSFKFKYDLSQSVQFIFEPLYYGNITSVSSRKALYAQQRNIIATNLGFAFKF